MLRTSALVVGITLTVLGLVLVGFYLFGVAGMSSNSLRIDRGSSGVSASPALEPPSWLAVWG